MPRRLRELAQATRRLAGGYLFALRVYVLLVISRGIITALSLKRITARLGTPMEETPQEGVSAGQLRYARRVAWAIRRVARFTPTSSNCYPQALTAWWLLHKRRIPTTIYYGAAFDEDGTSLQAHVWVRCGPLMVTGGGPLRRFAPLTWFADIQPRVSPARQHQR